MSLRERFHRDGVLHIPQLLSPQELARLRAGYDWSMANPSPGAGWDQQGPKSFPLGQREGAVHKRLPLDEKPVSGASYSDNTTRRGMGVYGDVVVCPAILDVLSQLFEPAADELEASTRREARHRAEGGQVAAREDVRADEVGVLRAVRVVPIVGEGDHLDGGDAARLEVARDRAEEGGQVLDAHGLEHLDRDHLVVQTAHLRGGHTHEGRFYI